MNLYQKLKVLLLRKSFRFLAARANRGRTPGIAHRDLQVETGSGPIDIRIFDGRESGDWPLMVYFHGGGWVLGDLDTHQPFCEFLSQHSGGTVIAVNYRLAPEFPFPAAHDDCLAATRWVAGNIAGLGPSNGRMILTGDSAGGNLAIATCLELEPGVREQVAGQIVIYPVTDHYESNTPSYREKARGYTLSASMMRWFLDTYLADSGPSAAANAKFLRVMPLVSNQVAMLPPTLLVTAENDPLRDEGLAFADRLDRAGVSLKHRHFENATHGFVSAGPSAVFEDLMNEISSWLATTTERTT